MKTTMPMFKLVDFPRNNKIQAGETKTPREFPKTEFITATASFPPAICVKTLQDVIVVGTEPMIINPAII